LIVGGGSPMRLNMDGSLDNTFGTGGAAAYLGLGSYAIALQPDGKIVTAGTSGTLIGIGRTMPNGSPDISFGTNGLVTIPGNEAQGVAIMTDGRIVVGGEPYNFSF